MTSINFSTLKHMWSSSPLHYIHAVSTPSIPTRAMAIGSAVHCRILEPDMYAERYAVRPENLDGRTKAGKEWLASVVDRVRLTAADGGLVEAMASAVESHPVASEYLSMSPHDTETRIEWTDAETGAECHGTPDRVIYPGGDRVILLGLKTTRTIDPRRFSADAWRMGYNLQWAFYHDALIALGHRSPEVVEIVVEASAPHDVIVYRVPRHVLDIGRQEYRTALARILECRELKQWPGYADREMVYEPPAWADARLDDDFTVNGEKDWGDE